MKLYELIEPTVTKKNISARFDAERSKEKKDKMTSSWRPKSFSTGSYAYGSTTKDPHIFTKKSYYPSDLDYDAYYKYIETAMAFMKSNPYFPRVYNVKLITDKNGRIKTSYNIETLKGPEEFSPESILAMGKRMIKELKAEIEDIKNRYGRIEFDDIYLSKWIFDEIVNEIYGAVRMRDFDNIKDKKLIDAIQLIRDVIDSGNHFADDISTNNVMLRGTSQGPQLVLADPIWDFGRSQIKS